MKNAFALGALCDHVLYRKTKELREITRAQHAKHEKELALNSNPYYRIYFPLIIKAIHYKEFQCAEAL